MDNKIRVDLTGAPETMLATLYGRALDADSDHSILRDTYAKELVAQLDYDWPRTGINAKNAPSVTMRSAHFDRVGDLRADPEPVEHVELQLARREALDDAAQQREPGLLGEVHGYYNNERRHSAIGMRSPMDYEHTLKVNPEAS